MSQYKISAVLITHFEGGPDEEIFGWIGQDGRLVYVSEEAKVFSTFDEACRVAETVPELLPNIHAV